MSEVLEAVRVSTAPPEALGVVFAAGADGRLVGSTSVVRLVQAPPHATGDPLASP